MQENNSLGFKNVHADESQLQVLVVESADGMELNEYTSETFPQMLLSLRVRSNYKGYSASVALTTSFELWLTSNYVDESAYAILFEIVSSAAEGFQEISKTLVAFCQIEVSFLVSFPVIAWPAAFKRVSDWYETLNFDFLSFDNVSIYVRGNNYCIETFILLAVFAAAIIGIFAALAVRVRWTPAPAGSDTEARLLKLKDYCIATAVLIAFLVHPVISSRLLKFFNFDDYGAHRMLSADVRLSSTFVEQNYFASGIACLVLFTAGIPVAFFCILYQVARPEQTTLDFTKKGAAERFARVKINTRRYGLLFSKYEGRCWAWELVEVLRKTLLTGILVYLDPGTLTQIWLSSLLCLAFLLATTLWTPFVHFRSDVFSMIASLCTLLTLLLTLAKRAEMYKDGVLSEDLINNFMLVFQIVPVFAAVTIFLLIMRQAWKEHVEKIRRLAALPAVLRDQVPHGSL